MNNISTFSSDEKTAKFSRRIIWGCLALFGLLSLLAGFYAKWKVLAIAWIAFGAMSLAIPFGVWDARKKSVVQLIVGYGLAGGAMVTSTAIFLMPVAIQHHAIYGGVGIAFGVIAGYIIHIVDDQLWVRFFPADPVVIELTSHALLAGLIIGVIYASMPGLGLLLGVAIVSHKAPAGYAAARRLVKKGDSVLFLLLPACSVGLTALPMSMIHPAGNNIVNAFIFGLATGIFFHVAIDFLPSVEGPNGLAHPVKGHDKHLFSTISQRVWAAVSTLSGGLIVFVAWLMIH